MYLLDTNIISESRKLGTPRIDPRMARWFAHIDVETSFVSAMTIFELERGVRQMERRDAAQGSALRRWLDDQILATYEQRVLPLTRGVALICAGLHIPDPKSERDAWIAATAIDAQLTVVSRNISDFANIGVGLINPFDDEGDWGLWISFQSIVRRDQLAISRHRGWRSIPVRIFAQAAVSKGLDYATIHWHTSCTGRFDTAEFTAKLCQALDLFVDSGALYLSNPVDFSARFFGAVVHLQQCANVLDWKTQWPGMPDEA
jgi:toxin FitB